MSITEAKAGIHSYPGTQYRTRDLAPLRCDLDGGPWIEDETGIHCQTCRGHYVITATLTRTLRHRLTPERPDLLTLARDRRAARGGRRHAAAP